MKIQKALIVAILILATPTFIAAQLRHFEKDGVEFALDLPSPSWQEVFRVDIHGHVDFVKGNDEDDGYLRVRKLLLLEPLTFAQLFEQEEKWNLQRLPGYVPCNNSRFEGLLPGAAYDYEFTKSGQVMYGRIYYLRVDQLRFYMLRFTAAADRVIIFNGEMDVIARSFHLK